MRGAVGYTRTDQSKLAARQIAEQLTEQLGGEPPDAVLCFATIGHDFEVLARELTRLLPGAAIAGCSVFGHATSRGTDEATFSVSAYAIRASRVSFEQVLATGDAGDFDTGFQLGKSLAQPLPSSHENELLWLFPCAPEVNCERLFAGIEQGMGRRVPILGGFASNDYQLSKTFQFAGPRVSESGVSGLLMRGPFQEQVGISHGSRPVGAARTVTKARGSRILEIDGVPALAVLRNAVGASATEDYGQLVNVVGIGIPFEGVGYSEDLILRAILGFDETEQSLVVGTEISEGQRIFLTIRDAERVLAATGDMTKRLLSRLRDPDSALFFYVNCDGRGSYLFGDPEPDVDAMRAALGANRAFGGFLAFGEIAPVTGENLMHSFTGVLVALEESE